jgi:S-adenosylmethionine:tRNA ribosyltransferase-isomerase
MSGSDIRLPLSDYDYEVPPELVAQRPAPRGTSRMLLAPSGPVGSPLEDLVVSDLAAQLRPGDCLVLNDTRVLRARLRARLPTGGAAELLLLEPREGLGDGSLWEVMAKPGRKLTPGRALELPDGVRATVESVEPGGTRVLRFPIGRGRFFAWLESVGEIPLPPYVRRRPEEADERDFQTAWASRPGAVAAPTAGLHLGEPELSAVAARGVDIARVTLHVGAGTFLPVETEDALQHPMHSERWEISEEAAAALQRTRDAGGRIVCVGTTVLRTLETCWRENGDSFRPGSGRTEIFLHPLDPPRCAQGLLTNFHWPRTTLVLLAAGWLGSRERWREVYEAALARRYRLFSYGDCMLSLRD